VFYFVENQPLELPAYADTHVLDVQLPTEQAASFLLELAGQPAVKIIFPGRDEAPWVVSSNGAKPAIGKMASCLKAASWP
jgi:hypothetical protein